MNTPYKSIYSPEDLRFASDCYDEACVRLVHDQVKLDGGQREAVAAIILRLSHSKLSKNDLVAVVVRSFATTRA